MAETTIFFPKALTEKDGKYVQMGQHCKTCGRTTFPVTELCMNCSSDKIEKVQIATEGTVYSWSVTRVPVGGYKPPFIGAYIDLTDGVRIFAQVKTDPDTMKTGMKVKVETGVIYTEKDGTEVLGYYYVPANGGAR